MNSFARFVCFGVSCSLRYRQGYRIFPFVSSYLIIPQLRFVTGIKMQSRGKTNGSDECEEMGDSIKRATRSEVRQKERKTREYYLSMNLEEKRKFYKCKKKFKTLKEIPTWNEYYHENKEHLMKKFRKSKPKPVNQEINYKVSIWKGDITTLEIDAIVNAANSSLLGGSGVDGAIHEAAGKKLYEECLTLHGCKTGEAKITGGYKLPARYVIHTVGPIGEKELLLEKAYENSLKVMMENKLRSVALPCISTGIYGYDNQKACHVALKVVQKFLTENADSVDRVIFCLFLQKDVDLYEENMPIYFPVETAETSTLEGKEDPSSDVEMKERESTSETKVKSKVDSQGKEKTSCSANKEKSLETMKSKDKDKDNSLTKEDTKTLKVKGKEDPSSDVEMKERESISETKVKSKVDSQGKEKEGKEKTSCSANKEKSLETTKSKDKDKDSSLTKEDTKTLKVKGHDTETKSNNKSSDDTQALQGRTKVSKNENGDKETDGTQFEKCDPVHSSRM